MYGSFDDREPKITVGQEPEFRISPEFDIIAQEMRIVSAILGRSRKIAFLMSLCYLLMKRNDDQVRDIRLAGRHGDEFTFRNVRIVVQAVVNYLKSGFRINFVPSLSTMTRASFRSATLSRRQAPFQEPDPGLPGGQDAPTQAQAYQIINVNARGDQFHGVLQSAEYNGLKFSTHTGAPLFRSDGPDRGGDPGAGTGLQPRSLLPRTEFITKIDLRSDYLEFLQRRSISTSSASGIKVGLDFSSAEPGILGRNPGGE